MPKKYPALSKKQRGGLFLASGSTHPELARSVAEHAGLALDETERKRFPNGELYVRFGESVRGKHAILLQSHAQAGNRTINDSIMELILMGEAARGASAREVTAVIPHLGYARQDRKARGREPISAAVIIRQLAGVGINRIVSLDMHSSQTQGAFEGPFDHLTAEPLLRRELKRYVRESDEDVVIVAPDVGRAKAAELYSHQLGVGVVNMVKVRDKSDPSNIIRPQKPKGVRRKTCLIIDDMIDTAGTLASAAESLHDAGASHVIAAATHGLFSDPALERLEASPIDQLLVTDSVPLEQPRLVLGDRLQEISVAPLLARAICEIATDGSISSIFKDQQNYS